MAGVLVSAPSFSVHSVAESSGAAISEAEEIHEVHKLLKSGEHAFKTKSFQRALRCYNEALEIDELSVESLAGRAAVYIELGNYTLAQKDAEKAISMDQENTQGHYLLGIALHNLGYYRESLLSFLKALNLDSDHNHVDVLTNNIATIASQIVTIPDKLLDDIPDMEPYKKLTEIGCCLYQGRKYDTCVKVLNAAQKLETNQKGITMKVQLTLANAHAALKHNELAVSLYQECLQTALSAHDASYQTKALVSIASLFLELGDTHQAIIHYQKLLDLQRELQGEDSEAPLPEYWSKDLQCALHLNLSIAYKTIGNMRLAVQHARLYCELIGGHHTASTQRFAEARSHQNVGMLYELLGQYEKALEHYKQYLALSKEQGHKKGIAQAYGCLGSVYAQLGNRQLALTYHDQHIAMAKKEKDARLLTTALELCADTNMLLKDYEEAAEKYDQMFHVCPTNDLKTKTTGMCKLGNAYRKQNRFQYALFYFEQARDIAEELDLMTLKVMCDLNIACMLQHSTQHSDLDKASTLFSRLIPVLEAKLSQHQEEDTFCPEQLHEQLDDCYNGIQNVLAKMGNGNLCLQYSEAQKKRFVTQIITGANNTQSVGYNLNNVALFDSWSVQKIGRVMDQQNATVVYFHLLPGQILSWVLKPGQGVARFYSGQSYNPNENYITKISNLINEIKTKKDTKHAQYECENRALTLKADDLGRKRNKNKQLSESYKREQYRNELAKEIEEKEESEISKIKRSKPAERQLFDLLFAPLDDLISKLDEGSPLVVIPDKVLFSCPFGMLKDWNNKMLNARLRITVCPSLFILDKVVQNELNQLKQQDDLEFERTQARLGGIPKIMQNIDFLRLNMGSPDYICLPDGRIESRNSTKDPLNLRQVSNPRLLTSGVYQTGNLSAQDQRKLAGENTLVSIKSKTSNTSLKDVKFSPRTKNQLGIGAGKPERTVTFVPTDMASKSRTILTGAPTSIDKMISAHTMSTLTTRTSTNTDITQSHAVITDFNQVSDPDKCVVIGAPKLPKTLLMHGKEWNPAIEMAEAENECYRIADACDVTAIVAEKATKDEFLKQLQTASVIHIATMGCQKEGFLILAPNPNRCESGVPSMHSYVVTLEEIMQLSVTSRLVVLSSGFGPRDRDPDLGHRLAAAFLAAGAQCVMMHLWAAPNAVLDKFYHHFYATLQAGSYVTHAVAVASKFVQKDERYRGQGYWASPAVIGKDVYLSIKFIRHAQLDQMIDRVEEQVSDKMDTHPLNPRPLVPPVASKEESLNVLQECMSSLLAQHSAQPHAIPNTIILIDGAIKRLHVNDINERTAILPAVITQSEGAMRLVKYLGFHFQARGADLEEPYVIFPHWNHDELLIPAYESLCSLQDICEVPTCSRAMYELLPASQDNVSYLVDMLCITRHAPEIQLKVTDLSVRPLWKSPRIRTLLTQLGYQQIGTLLYFNNVYTSRKLLSAALQLLIALSVHKTSILLHKLDVNLLGGPHSQKGSSLSLEHIRLPTLMPILLPRNQLRMSTPWLSNAERSTEMNEKMKLSRTKSDLTSEYQFYLSKAKTWHQTSVAAQANQSLDEYGRPQSTPQKVKVISGGNASTIRKPVHEKKALQPRDSDVRRDYAHYVYRQRIDDVGIRHKHGVRKLYIPYTVNA